MSRLSYKGFSLLSSAVVLRKFTMRLLPYKGTKSNTSRHNLRVSVNNMYVTLAGGQDRFDSLSSNVAKQVAAARP